MKTRYDFTDAADFLDNSVPLHDLYEDVLEAMELLSVPKRHIDRRDIFAVWNTLSTCADFIDTITVKPKANNEKVA